MSIRRRKKDRQFTQIDNAALRNPNLSLKAKGLLAIMMSCPEDWQFYMEWLAKQSRDGLEAHQTGMKELQEQGYVVRERTNGPDGKMVWEYTVDDEQMFQPARKFAERPTDKVSGQRVPPQPTIGGKSPHGGTPFFGSTIGGFTIGGSTIDGKSPATKRDLTKTDLNKKGGGDLFARESELASALEKISSSSGQPAAANPVVPEKALTLEAGNSVAPGASPEAVNESQDDQPETNPSLQEVPGAAADGARGAEMASLPARVLEFGAVDGQELHGRPAALPGTPVYQLLEHLLGAQDLPTMLAETTRTGKLPRTRWLQLTLAEVQAVEAVASAEDATSEIPLRTLVSRGLDRLIGSTWNGQRKAASTPVAAPVIGGQSLEMLPTKATAPAEPEEPEEGKLQPGAKYCRKADGVVVELVRTERVTNRAGAGERFVLSDGHQVGALDLMLKFEFVGRSGQQLGQASGQ